MTISSWNAAYHIANVIGIDISDATEMAKDLIPDESNTDLYDFIRRSSIGFDRKSLLVGAMVSSIVMEKVSCVPVGDYRVVSCIICGNHKPVAATPEDEFGWVCTDCESIYRKIKEMDRMKAIQRDEDILKGKYEHTDHGGIPDESTQR